MCFSLDAKLTDDQLAHNAELLNNIKSYEIFKPYRVEGREKRNSHTTVSSLINGVPSMVAVPTLFLSRSAIESRFSFSNTCAELSPAVFTY